MRSVVLLCCVLAACTITRTPAEPDGVTVTPPAEDGTRYIAVSGDPMTSPRTLASQWKRQAKRACGGDYVLINDERGSMRRAGLVVSRMHEGFVRCVIEEEELGGSPKRQAARNGASEPRSRTR